MRLGELLSTQDRADVWWIEDPGHGWLRLPTWMVEQSGIEPTEFSYLSQAMDVSYLEEDCDAPAFLEAVFGDDREKWPKFENRYRAGQFYAPNRYPAPTPPELAEQQAQLLLGETHDPALD